MTPGYTPSQDDTSELASMITQYQETYFAWKRATELAPDEQELHYHNLGCIHDMLWPMLAPPLREVARKWRGSGSFYDMRNTPDSYDGMNDALDALAMNLYLHVIEALPRLKINNDKNLVAYIKQIAWNRMFDEEYLVYRNRGYWIGRMQEMADVGELIDPKSSNAADHLIESLDRQLSRRAVLDFWQATLSDNDYTIMHNRYICDPPVPFQKIALQLGPGWTSEAVRQRCHRVIERSRKHLQTLGFEPD